jgi:cyclase
MFRPRVIPVLLLNKDILVKSKKFKDYNYIGDAINAVRIFNDLKADELVFLDINATKENRLISLNFVREVGEEANMPFAVGGGIKTIQDIRDIINAGAEKIVIGSAAAKNPEFIAEAAKTFGSSTIVVCIDVKRNIWGKEKVWIENGKTAIDIDVKSYAMRMEKMGAGELIIQSIENDGMRQGYNLHLIEQVSRAVTIPVVALGGAGNLEHMKEAYTKSYANGLAAGSMFVYQGKKQGVLISYPEKPELNF